MNQLGIFAKYWQPGEVKTRLADGIGALAASQVYRLSLEILTRRLSDVADARIVAFTPADRRLEFEHLVGDDWALQPQSYGNLGTRMQHFFAAALQAGASHTVLIGSDSPTIPKSYVFHAFELLNQYPTVLGPTSDGGYYLVGTAGQMPPIFDGIQWSSPSVFRQTVERLERARTPFAQLPEWYDVDNVEDLRRLNQELQDLIHLDPLWSEIAFTIRRILDGTS